MSDFASALMIRILAAGMRLHGLVPPTLPMAGARVTLAHKRSLVASALAQGGWACLPRLGQGMASLRGDPVHQALAGCATPHELLARWCRLERYIHSRHRSRVETGADGSLHVTHLSLRAAEPPLPAEDLVVLGVLGAAMQDIGMDDVQVTVAGCPVYPAARSADLARLVAAGQTACWHLAWQAPAQTATPHRKIPSLLSADKLLDGPPLARQLGQLVLGDLIQVPVLAQVAHQLNMAPRSLQRQLADDGLSYSAVVAETRCRAAAWYLMHSAQGMAETGFVCGFADQAHFTRVFKQRVGVPPARYRKELGQPVAA